MFVHRLVCPVLALLAWLALPSGPAHGQMPKLPGISGPPAGGGSPAAAGAVPSATSLAGELAKTEAKLAHIKVPGGISEDEVTAYRNELRRTVFNLERQIGLIQAAADPPPGDPSAAPGQPAGPPFSFLDYDKLRDSRDEEADRLEAMRASVRMLEGLLENQRERLKAATKDSQTAAENLQRNLKQPGEAAALWRVEAAAAAVQAAATGISYLGMRLKAVQPSVEQTTANLQRLESEIAAMADQVVVSAEDLATAERDTAEKLRSLELEFATFSNQRNSLLAKRERLQQQIASGGQATAGAEPEQPQDRPEALALNLAATEAELRSATSSMELIALMGRIHTELGTALGDVRRILHGDDPQERAGALKRLQEARTLAQSWLTFAESQRTTNSGSIAEQQAKVTTLEPNSPELAADTRVLAAEVRVGELLERVRQLGAFAVRKLERWIGDGEDALARRPLGRKVADALAKVWAGIKAVWAFPVYHYSDEVEVGGQVIKVSRGLSLGRLLGALVFLFLAHRAAVFIIRRIQRGFAQRQWGNAALFPTMRRWTMVAVDVSLLLLTLHLLQIPLTAFAFLGGALAIGFGFGTQTIFKNLISGLIVLNERKIKVGDILEVDAFIGRVSSVDTRSTVLRGFDGVETVVPNSMLLENRITNWTMSNPRQRRVVRVGVAYGSPVQRASAILAEAADRHGLVLKDPAPLVLFEDFAADSLMLALYFWVELTESTNANQIASDLRFMIEKRFGEAGIVIAFPQRDLHLSAAAPLPVRLVAELQTGQPASSAAAAGQESRDK